MSTGKIFSLPMRVYFQDTDAGGVVYHANYLNFMERARTEWLRSHGYSNAGLMKEFGVLFVVRALKLDYRKPALLDDLLAVTVQIRDFYDLEKIRMPQVSHNPRRTAGARPAPGLN